MVVADDHQIVLEALGRALRERGFDVVAEVTTADDAVDATLRHEPDLVVLDVSMPPTSGLEACRRIVAARPGTTVVMLTMHADASTLTAAIDAGASGYLLKASGTEELADDLRRAAAGETVIAPALQAVMVSPTTRDRALSARETEVLQAIADGCGVREAADRMYISEKTVRNHLAAVYRKLGVSDRTQALLEGIRRGLVTLR